MNPYCGARFSRSAGLFSFGLLDVPAGYACVALTCEKPPADFGLGRLATGFLNNPGSPAPGRRSDWPRRADCTGCARGGGRTGTPTLFPYRSGVSDKRRFILVSTSGEVNHDG